MLKAAKPSYIKKHDAWSVRLTIDPLAVPLTEWLARWPAITPNAVTLLSFAVTLGGIGLYSRGGHANWVIGALLWQLGYILDACDGKLARKLGVCSPFGAKLDSGLDKIKKALSFAALIAATGHSTWLLVTLALLNYALQHFPLQPNQKLLEPCLRRGITSYFDPLDAFFVMFVLGPLTGNFELWLIVTVACQLAWLIINVAANAWMDKNHEPRG